jgi:hypothetical protein
MDGCGRLVSLQWVRLYDPYIVCMGCGSSVDGRVCSTAYGQGMITQSMVCSRDFLSLSLFLSDSPRCDVSRRIWGRCGAPTYLLCLPACLLVCDTRSYTMYTMYSTYITYNMYGNMPHGSSSFQPTPILDNYCTTERVHVPYLDLP